MKKGSKIGIVGGVVLLLAVLLYFLAFGGGKSGYVTDDWDSTYDPEKRDPYGTFMLKELLDTTGMFGNFLQIDEKLQETLKDHPDVNDIYFFVGKKNYLNDSSAQFLLDFVANGNSAFMAAEEFPYDFIAELCFDPDFVIGDRTIDSTLYLKFNHPDLKGKRYEYKYVYNNKVEPHAWHFINDSIQTELYYPTTLLGANTKNQTNFIKISYGEGFIYLISTPYVFTNISMMRRDGFQYAENVLRHIPPGRVQWDRYNLVYHYTSDQQGNGNGNEDGGEDRQSILQFIMQNPPLAWAFVILLIGAVLYALFKGKRMQKVIPATESKENMSLQYINTLSSLYLQERKHNKLVRLKEKTFLNFIADHYYIYASKADDKFIGKVAVKSHVPEEKIREIFTLFDELESSSVVTDQELIALHQKIEHFYKTCR